MSGMYVMKRETNMREQEHGKGKRGKSGKTRQRKETTPFGIGHIFRFFLLLVATNTTQPAQRKAIIHLFFFCT